MLMRPESRSSACRMRGRGLVILHRIGPNWVVIIFVKIMKN